MRGGEIHQYATLSVDLESRSQEVSTGMMRRMHFCKHGGHVNHG
jgi:hypothetical protein